MSTVTLSSGCIISTLAGLGSKLPKVRSSGPGGPIGCPFRVMKAKLAGSMPTVFRQSELFATLVFWFWFSWKMASAAQHLVGSQLTPGGHFTQEGG